MNRTECLPTTLPNSGECMHGVCVCVCVCVCVKGHGLQEEGIWTHPKTLTGLCYKQIKVTTEIYLVQSWPHSTPLHFTWWWQKLKVTEDPKVTMSERPKPAALLGQGVGWVLTETGGKEAGCNLKKSDMATGPKKNQLEPARSKMAEDPPSRSPSASLSAHCNTLAC